MISFRSGITSEPIHHRVVSIDVENRTVTTKGDTVTSSETSSFDDVVGKVPHHRIHGIVFLKAVQRFLPHDTYLFTS